MRYVSIFLLALATLAVAGRTSAPVRAQSSSQLSNALLTVGDLGAGWQALSTATTGSGATSAGSATGLTCSGLQAEPQALASVGQTFEQPVFGQVVDEVVSQYAPGDAKADLDLLSTEYGTGLTCSGNAPDGSSQTATFAPLSLDNYGEQSLAYQVSFTSASAAYAGDMVVIRRGDFTTLLLFATVAGSDIGPAYLSSLAQDADTLLGNLAGE